MSKLNATPEILGVFGSHDEATVQKVASSFDQKLVTVQNSSNEVHLALPFYSDLESKASGLSDSDLEVASGGAGAVAMNNEAASSSFVHSNSAVVNYASESDKGEASGSVTVETTVTGTPMEDK